MKKFVTWIVLCTIGFVYSQNLSDPIPTDSSVRIGTLENGLKYYIKHNGYPEKKVELRLGINAGSILENDDQQGLAHFLEHMNFNGTKNFPKNELLGFLQNMGVEFGADLNAYTGFNETVYMLPLPLDDMKNLDSGLLVLEDWAFNALLETEDIDDERGVILEEKRVRGGASSRMMQEWLPIAYKNSQYSKRLPIGTDEILTTFKPETLRDFYKMWYRPNLMTVVVVGDINVDEIEAKIKKNFSKYKNPANAADRKTFGVPNYAQPNIAVVSDKEATGTSAQITYFNPEEAKPQTSIQDYKTGLVRSLFSTMLNNRFDELRNAENPPFNYAYSYYGGTFAREKEAYNAVVSSAPDKLKEAYKVLLAENKRVKDNGFVASELDRAKQDLLSNMERQFNNRDKIESSRWVQQYLNNYLEQEPIPSLEWENEMFQKLIPSITLADVNGLIEKFIQENNYSVIVTGPKEDMSQADIAQITKTVNSSKLDAYADSSEGMVLMEGTPKAGKIKKAKTENGVTTLTLKNGVTVKYQKTDLKNDEILMRAYSLGGESLFTDEEWKNTHFATSGLTEAGVNGISKNDLTKLLAGKNVYVSPFIGSITEGFNGQSSNKDLETLFQLTHLYFTKLNYDPKAFASFQQKQEGMYGTILNRPEFFFYNEMSNFNNVNNARNANIVPLTEDWTYTDYKLAYDKYQERFANPADFTFFFVGSIDEAQLKEFAATYLGSLTTSKEKENFKVIPDILLKGKNENVVKKGEDTKAIVTLDFNNDTTYDKKESIAVKMLAAILEIKLTEVLREQEGGVYSLRTNGSVSREPNSQASISIYIPTGVELYEKMEALALAEVEKVKTNGPTQEDLNKTRETILTDFKEDIQKNSFFMSALTNEFLYKENASEATKYDQLVKSVTLDDIKAVANKYCNENLTVGILIPEKEVQKVETKEIAVENVSAIDVVNNYLKASAMEKDAQKAKAKLQKVKKVIQVGKLNMQGMEVPLSLTEIHPNIMEMEMDMTAMGQGKMKQVFNPSGSYMEMMGQKQDMPMDEEIAARKGVFSQAFYTDKEVKFNKAIEVDGTKYYVLETTFEPKQLEYYNATTGLLEKTSTLEGVDTKKFSNYAEFKGYKSPKNVEIIENGMPMKMNFDSVTVE